MRRKPHLPRPYNPIQFYTTLYNSTQYKKLMKKVYIAPQTEAMEILANNVLMASPGGKFIPTNNNAVGGVYGD